MFIHLNGIKSYIFVLEKFGLILSSALTGQC